MTYPPELLRHDISDEELKQLEQGEDQGLSFDLFLFFLAVFLGSVIQGGERVIYVTQHVGLPSFLDIFTIVLPIVSIVLTLAFAYQWNRTKGAVKSLARVLRARPRRPGK